MVTEVPPIHFIDVRNHQGGSVSSSEARKQCCSSQSTEQSRQRDDQAVVRASDGERDRVKSFSEALTRSRQWQCMELSSDIVNMTVSSDEINENATALNNPLQFKISVQPRKEHTRHHQSL